MERDFLSRILEHKREEVEEARRTVSEESLRDLAEATSDRRPFLGALSAPGPHGANIIAEIKRASPSKGPIREDLDPARLAGMYEEGGAAALSVLTDRAFFKGDPKDLKQARAATNLPVLRKDFVISFYQIVEAAAMGADAVLLIARALDRAFLKECLELCTELNLGALVEVHSEKELEDATWAGGKLIGVNNRDLRTFRTDIQTSIDMVRCLEPGQIAVAESGIRNRADVERLLEAGIGNFLIGESLVRSNHPEHFLKNLLGIEDGKDPDATAAGSIGEGFEK